jgi:hypothetical protein
MIHASFPPGYRPPKRWPLTSTATMAILIFVVPVVILLAARLLFGR